jgi:hypothetical protein
MRELVKRFTSAGRRLLTYLIDEVSLGYYVAIFVLVVVIFGSAYSLLSPLGHGVGKDMKPIEDLSFLNGIYFSIVTVSSLGYGDMHPLGFSKVLACFEVLFGLAWMGVLVAKVTSRRLSYHVQRLFVTDAEKRLEEFSVQFGMLHSDLKKAMGGLGRVYQVTPGENPGEDKDRVLSNFNVILTTLHGSCSALATYLSSEVEHNYFSIVRGDSVQRVGDNADKTFFQLSQLIISLSPQAKTEILNGETRQRISETLMKQKLVCETVQRYSKDSETQNRFSRVLETCDRVLEAYFTMPAAILATAQPDQVLMARDVPQEPAT